MNSVITKPARQHQRGFTLMEVLVAIAVTAIIAGMAASAFNSAELAHRRTQKTLQNIQRLDRAWLTIESDLRNALGKTMATAYGEAIPAMVIDESQEEWLTLLRGGRPNPMHFYRSEMARVRYKIEDEILVRELWNDPANMDENLVQTQKLLDGVEEMRVKILPPGARSVKEGPWLDEWPPSQALAALPKALEITMVLKDKGEITRLFALVPGI